MKKHPSLFCILLLTVLVLFSSCKKDEDIVPYNISGFFTANTDSKAHIYKLTDDMGNVYNVENNDLIIDYYNSGTQARDTTVRVVATLYAENDGKYVISSKTLPISTIAPNYNPNHPEGPDPIKLKSIYIGGGHLNVVLGIMTENGQGRHELFYMLKNDPEHIRIKLYHNAHGDNPVYTQNIYLSIPLTQPEYNIQKNDTVLFSYKSFEGDCVEKLVYR